MINSVKITNHLNESVTIELRNPEKSGFLIKDIKGIEPIPADINLTAPSPYDGSSFNSARLPSRNIVFTLVLMGTPTVQESRRATYKYFPTKKPITMVFDTQDRNYEIVGYVESNSIGIFDKQETAVISVICPEPYLNLVGTIITEFSSVQSLFEFPFQNNSLVTNLIVFASQSGETEKVIYYEGDIDVGIMIYIHSIGSVVNLSITNVQTQETMTIDHTKLVALLGTGISSGDDIVISTIKGDKYIYLTRGGIVYNILNSLDKDTNWFTLTRGDNTFIYEADSGITNLTFRIENKLSFEGI